VNHTVSDLLVSPHPHSLMGLRVGSDALCARGRCCRTPASANPNSSTPLCAFAGRGHCCRCGELVAAPTLCRHHEPDDCPDFERFTDAGLRIDLLTPVSLSWPRVDRTPRSSWR
jgi:hypothetical protein